jgi:hypothetical protein
MRCDARGRDLADEEMVTQLFCVVFKHSEGDVDHPRKLQSNVLVEEDKTVERLAKGFAAKVPKLEFSQAESYQPRERNLYIGRSNTSLIFTSTNEW